MCVCVQVKERSALCAWNEMEWHGVAERNGMGRDGTCNCHGLVSRINCRVCVCVCVTCARFSSWKHGIYMEYEISQARTGKALKNSSNCSLMERIHMCPYI